MPTGFIHFFRAKIAGLFKVFPGTYFEISRIFQSLCRNAKKWELELIMETYTGDGYSRCPYDSMYHGVIREHWERINKFLYCLHLPSILQKVVWSAVKHLSTFKNKKTTTKTNISTSKQGLEIELLKFKSLQDANETCRVQAVLDDRVSGHNILNRWILFSQKGRQRYLVVIIIDCIGTCLSGSLYSMAERQGQEKLHHFGLKKAFPTQNIYNIFKRYKAQISL